MSLAARSAPLLFAVVGLVGCQSPYYADRGAVAGGVGGAGLGALVGSASGHPGVGAAVGAGVGALTGGLIGSGLDDVNARNQAQIAAATASNGGVSVNDVLTMSRSGVDEELIVNQIHARGVVKPVDSNDLIALQQGCVSKRVVATLQSSPVSRPAVVAPVVPGPVYYYPPPPPYYAYPGPAWNVWVR